jgi:hypothetical protein
MSVQKGHYEELLAGLSHASAAIALLKRYRPYLEMLPSMRRSMESLITIPLPVVKLHRADANRNSVGAHVASSEAVALPCDLAILMCDPEWKIKTGVEIFVFIHRPGEDFSDLLSRWRQTQVLLNRGYEWEMPLKHQHILNESADNLYPLFVVFDQTPERIKRGLNGAFLPSVIFSISNSNSADEQLEPTAAELLWSDEQRDSLL